jgi:hypothetical protein
MATAEGSSTVRTTASPSPDIRWARDPRTLWRSGPGFVVLLGPGDALPVALHGTGVALWEAFDSPRTTREIAVLLAGTFDAPVDVVEADVSPVLSRLAEAGALYQVP